MQSAFAIEKLDDSNYSSWCVQMKSVLIHTELWKVVCGAIKAEGTEQEVAAFKAKDEKALASLMLSIKPSQILHVKNCKTSAEAWEKFQSMYKPKGPAKKISLFKKLLNLKLNEGDNMNDHINEFSEILESLNEIDIEIPEEMTTIILLTSLSESFENFIVAMETRDELPKFSILKNKLIEEGTRRAEKDQRLDDHAYVVRTNPKSNSFDRNNFSKNKIQNNNNSKRFVKCYICQKRGHCANACRENNKHNSKNSVKEEKIFVSSTSISSSNQRHEKRSSWCIDSGATSHLCSDRKLFITFKALQQWYSCNVLNLM